jgi:DNA-binding GntR family transcriptional regulator
MTPSPQEKKRPRTAHQYVLEALRTEILMGRMSEGKRLRQEEIASWLGVSTTPVREALRDLVTEGLIVFDAHRGAVVRGLTLDDAREIYRLRMVLEPLLIERTLALLDDAPLEHAASVHARMCATTEVDEWTRLNQEFHSVFWAPQASSRLAHILEGLRAAAMPYIALSLLYSNQAIEQSNEEHEQILSHFRARDLASAVRLNHSHLEMTLRIIERAIRVDAG